MNDLLRSYIEEHQLVFKKIAEMRSDIDNAAEILVQTILKGQKILVCGNGGSAADAQHFAAELVGRFEKERLAMPAIALTTDTSALTAIANDYGYETVFARQVDALGNKGDTLVGISTSGNSENVMLAIESAQKKGVKTVGLLGRDGGKMADIVDAAVIVPHANTARIQEVHIFVIHYWSARIENNVNDTH